LKAKEKLWLIHSDVCGHLQVEIPVVNKYFCTCIDDVTRRTWVFVLKRKNEVLDAFKRFKTLVEKHSGMRFKVLRTNGDEEYISSDFSRLC